MYIYTTIYIYIYIYTYTYTLALVAPPQSGPRNGKHHLRYGVLAKAAKRKAGKIIKQAFGRFSN